MAEATPKCLKHSGRNCGEIETAWIAENEGRKKSQNENTEKQKL